MSRKVERFEDLIAWEKAMDFAVLVYELTRQRPFSRDFALADQSHRAAISVPSNIAEGFERGTRAEFHRFLSIAKGSCAELRTQIHLAKRLGYIDAETAAAALSQGEEVSKIIGGLRVKVAAQRDARPR
ncbi:MAG TPA: four helix bundle protein [Thermoanaerobaculia bacterium]|nr:four helix bundle protein [Thermoanaerobaculia bacterium]